jgi:glycosyltransferase involved in cell wall biosynthesis
MKKILCYIDMMDRTGAQRVMKNLVTFLSEKGYEVVLVNDFDISYQDNSFDIPKTVKRIFLRKTINGNIIIKNLERMIRLRKSIVIEKPDVILSFLGRPNIRTLISAIGLDVKKIVSVRNDPNYEYGHSIVVKRLINFLFRLADGIVFQTEDAKKYFNSRIQNKSSIILNPVDSTFFLTNRKEIQNGIVTFGRLEPQKNHKLLIDAYALVASRLTDIDELFIYGEGELRDTLENYVCSIGLTDKIHFPGNVENVSEILSKARMFVLSSDYEGLPNALMEAMACGTPLISTDCPCGGPKMLIKNDLQGILVKCNDVESMANAIQKILLDNEYRMKMSKKVRERAEIFEGSRIFDEWEEYLNSVLEG